jgi:hypothetical protein
LVGENSATNPDLSGAAAHLGLPGAAAHLGSYVVGIIRYYTRQLKAGPAPSHLVGQHTSRRRDTLRASTNSRSEDNPHDTLKRKCTTGPRDRSAGSVSRARTARRTAQRGGGAYVHKALLVYAAKAVAAAARGGALEARLNTGALGGMRR